MSFPPLSFTCRSFLRVLTDRYGSVLDFLFLNSSHNAYDCTFRTGEALIGEVKTNLTEIEAQIATKAAQTDLDSARTALESTDNQLKSRLDKLESDSSALSGSLADYAKIQYVDTQNAAQDTNITTNKNNIDANTALITANKSAIDSNAANITTNAGNIATNTAAISAMDTAYKAADTQIRSDFAAADEATLSSAKTYTDDEIAKLSSGLDGATGDLGALTQRVTAAEGEIDTLQAEMDAVEAKAAANETNIATNTANIATNTTNIATNTQGVADNKAAIEALKGTTDTLGALAFKDTVENADVAKRRGENDRLRRPRKADCDQGLFSATRNSLKCDQILIGLIRIDPAKARLRKIIVP